MKAMRLFLLATSAALIFFSCSKDSPVEPGPQVLTWSRTFGETSDDVGYAVCATSDGGYVLAGATYSFNAMDQDMLIVKVNANGDKQWQRLRGGAKRDRAMAVCETRDGGIAVVGITNSYSTNNEDRIELLKLRADGSFDWSETFGFGVSDRGYSIDETADGGFMIAGSTRNASLTQMLIVKTNSKGKLLWSYAFPGLLQALATYGRSTRDGGFILVGFSTPDLNQVDGYIWRLNAAGQVEWEFPYGSTVAEAFTDVAEAGDSGFVATGFRETDATHTDGWLIGIDRDGQLRWEKTYGEASATETMLSIISAGGGGYVIAGLNSNGTNGGDDAWLVRVDEKGNAAWTRTIGMGQDDVATCIRRARDGGFICAGSTEKGSWDSDAWIFKTNASGEIHK